MRPPPRASREAIDWLVLKLELSEKQLAAATKRAEKRARMAVEIHQMRIADTVLRASLEAAKKGTPLREAKNDLKQQLVGVAESSLELGLRNNLQSAYSAGRVRQMLDPDTLATRPFWVFDAVLDRRTTPLCQACHGTTLPAGSAWWNTHKPPLHHRCRSAIRCLTPRAAEARGLTETPTRRRPQDGWGALDDALVLPTDVDPALAKAARRRRG